MSIPTKVTVECTADGYTTTVYAGDEVVSHRASRMESRGRARSTEKGDVFDDLPDEFEDLADEIDSVTSAMFGIAVKLYGIREDWT